MGYSLPWLLYLFVYFASARDERLLRRDDADCDDNDDELCVRVCFPRLNIYRFGLNERVSCDVRTV